MGAITFSLDKKLLDFFVAEMNIEVFVETGTFKGDSLAAASEVIRECHSVELSKEYFSLARQRFSQQPNVHLNLGDSAEYLSNLASELVNRPTLYWLDAHWCVADNTAGDESQSPLLEEIKALGKLGAASVLCIDDARLYLCPPPAPHRYADWPDFHGLMQVIQACAPEHRSMILNDVFIVYPAALYDSLRRFAYEHGVDWLHYADLILRPPPPPPPRKRKFWRRVFRPSK